MLKIHQNYSLMFDFVNRVHRFLHFFEYNLFITKTLVKSILIIIYIFDNMAFRSQGSKYTLLYHKSYILSIRLLVITFHIL